MYIYKTKLTKTTQIPTQLEFLNTAFKRGLLPKEKDQRLMRNLQKGAEGEDYVFEMLEKFGCEHWIAGRNLWLEYMGNFESDIFLLTTQGCYNLEIKNYDGKFEYKNSRCYLNGKKLQENCVQQAEKAMMNLQKICATIDRSIVVKGALLFVGEHNEVSIESAADGIQIVTRNTLRNFIQTIKREEERYMYKSIPTRKILNHFEKIEVLNPFGPLYSYSAEEVSEGHKGIYCKSCGSYVTQLTRKFLRCENGHEELRDEAVLRTINEFRLLTFQSEYMTKSQLLAFLDGQVSDNYLIRLLRENFIRVNFGRYSKYTMEKRDD